MQENNFEKEVQQSLQNLQLEPTPPVWDAVHARITPERRRRRLILWWLPLAAGIMLGGWWWANQNNEPKKSWLQTQSAVSGDTAIHQNVSVPGKGEKIISADKFIPEETAVSSSGTIKNSQQKTKATSSTSLLAKNESVAVTAPTNHLQDESKLVAPEKITASMDEQRINTSVQKEKTKTDFGNSDIPKSNDPVVSKGTITDSLATVVKSSTDSTVTVKTEKRSPDSSATIAQKRVKKKGKFLVQAGAGISISGTPVFATGKSAANPVQDNLFSGPQAYLGPVTGNMNTSVPPVYRSGLAFNIGAGWEQPLTKRSSISVAVNYRYNSIKVQPAQRWDTATVVRSNGMQDVIGRTNDDYNNVYHLIELPVQFRYQPLRKKDFWLYHGIGPAFTAAYKTVAFNNRTVNVKEVQWVGTSGANIGIRLSAQQKIYIGPSVRYHFNPILTKSNRHLTEAALLLTMPIHNKR